MLLHTNQLLLQHPSGQQHPLRLFPLKECFQLHEEDRLQLQWVDGPSRVGMKLGIEGKAINDRNKSEQSK